MIFRSCWPSCCVRFVGYPRFFKWVNSISRERVSHTIPSIHLSIYQSIHLPIYPSIHLSVCLSIYLSIDRSIERSIYPWPRLDISCEESLRCHQSWLRSASQACFVLKRQRMESRPLRRPREIFRRKWDTWFWVNFWGEQSNQTIQTNFRLNFRYSQFYVSFWVSNKILAEDQEKRAVMAPISCWQVDRAW